MFRAFLAVFLVLILAPSITHAWPARVVQVTDGDTITVEPKSGGERVKVRLHGIDAPELIQSSGEAARAFAHAVALYVTVDVQETPQRRDRYGRTVAVVFGSGQP
ncbi:thermonuclease family protein [Desulfovibrio sp.]|uniref:thermonuclease family protein n=1 Tax=Desulfovibrio sp. TaxID=885 RepID=UPI0025BFD1FE|nr:thermonuclease family protein [Desulfovibrio sp.]